jgi:hypothetical protein
MSLERFVLILPATITLEYDASHQQVYFTQSSIVLDLKY